MHHKLFLQRKKEKFLMVNLLAGIFMFVFLWPVQASNIEEDLANDITTSTSMIGSLDSDGDGVPDVDDLDDDNDGIPDISESFCDLSSTANSSSGTGIYQNEVYFFNWNGTDFTDGIHDGDNQTFSLANGLMITATFSNVVNASTYVPTDMNTWSGAYLHQLYNTSDTREALYGADGQDASFTVTFTATKNGLPFPLDLLALDAESTNNSNESVSFTTNGGNWTLVETYAGGGVWTGVNTTTVQTTDTEQSGGNTIYYSRNASVVDIAINAGGRQGVAFGIFLTCDLDGDGTPNHLDLDTDGDGIPDIVEAGGIDTNGDGHVDYPTPGVPGSMIDVDGDGLADALDNVNNGGGSEVTNGTPLANADSDGDGYKDFLDLDIDNDGIPDLVEAGGIDTNGDGRVDNTTDADEDGLADIYDENASDGPGTGGTNGTALVETDGSGNMLDGAGNSIDRDGDGLADHLDLDADNDGLPDIVEAGGIDTNGDGRVDSTTDADEDGLADIYDENASDGPGTGGTNGTALVETDGSGNMLDGAGNSADTDGDGLANHLDLDADNDGIPDLVETGGVDLTGIGMVDTGAAPWDSDGDGLADIYDENATDGPGPDGINGTALAETTPDTNNDGIVNASETMIGGGTNKVNADGDTVPNYLDLDSDNDGIVDLEEIGGVDTDDNGMVDALPANDSNGWLDAMTGEITTTADGADGNPYPDYTTGADEPDFDGDGLPNYLDIDADNDGIVDNTEAQATAGYIAPTTDSDGDGINDAYEAAGTIGSFGGAGIDPENSDSADEDDYLDLDADNDAEKDIVEGHDSDNDGIADSGSAANTGEATGADIDFDGLDDGFDNNTAILNATNSSTNPSSYPDTDAGLTDQDWRATNQNIAGRVWEDSNQDGQYDGGETLISGAVVTLYDSGDNVIATANTGADGSYLILDIPIGTAYYLIFTKPAAYGNFSPQDQAGGDDTLDSDTDGTGQTDPMNITLGNAFIYVSSGVYGAPVPVNLAYFKGEVESCKIKLDWSTANEENFSHFDVERSEDGINFKTIANLQAKGNHLGSVYSYEETITVAQYFYRLKGMDEDGRVTYSPVVVLRADCGSSNYQISTYPNPVGHKNTKLHVEFFQETGMETISIIDGMGRKIMEVDLEKEAKGLVQKEIEVATLPVGTYYLLLNGATKTPAIRFIRVGE